MNRAGGESGRCKLRPAAAEIGVSNNQNHDDQAEEVTRTSRDDKLLSLMLKYNGCLLVLGFTVSDTSEIASNKGGRCRGKDLTKRKD